MKCDECIKTKKENSYLRARFKQQNKRIEALKLDKKLQNYKYEILAICKDKTLTPIEKVNKIYDKTIVT